MTSRSGCRFHCGKCVSAGNLDACAANRSAFGRAQELHEDFGKSFGGWRYRQSLWEEFGEQLVVVWLEAALRHLGMAFRI